MKKSRFFFLLAGMMLAATAWAWDGAGTSSDPYLIASNDDWDDLSYNVKGGMGYADTYFKQTADNIDVDQNSCMDLRQIGGHTFQGHYDGNGNTMTLYITVTGGGSGSGVSSCAAPFGGIENAEIKNLHITGDVTTDHMRPASIAGFVNGECTISNCWSEATLSSTFNQDVDAGGFVGRVNGNQKLTMYGCLFTGKIYLSSPGYEGGGMVGYAQPNATVEFHDCVFAPSALNGGIAFYTFIYSKQSFNKTFDNCYYNTVAEDNAQNGYTGPQLAYWVKGVNGVEVQYFNNYYPPLESYDVSGIEIYDNGIMAGGVVYGTSGFILPVSYWESESGIYMDNDAYLGDQNSSPHDFAMGQNHTIDQPVADSWYNVAHHYHTSFSNALNDWSDNGGILYLLRNVEHNNTISLSGASTRTLDLKGHGIRHTSTSEVFKVIDGAELTIIDSNPNAEHKFSVNGENFATLNEENGTLTIHGGYITGGKGHGTSYDTSFKNGGGLYIVNGTVTMNGGTIIGNSTNRHAGGVFVANGGHFTLNSGAAIKHNKAGLYGGGLSVYGSTEDVTNTSSAEATINGGVIANNFATNEAGGIHTNTRDLPVSVTIKGASEVTGNKSDGNGGGVLMAANATITLSGRPSIHNNHKGDIEQNVYIPSGKLLTIADAGIDGANVGVTMKTPGVFTTNLSGHGDETNFFSDDDAYVVSLDANAEAQLVAPVEITAKEDPLHAGDWYTTIFYSNQAFKLPDGVTAYTATISNKNMLLHEVATSGQIIPAGEALILKSNAEDNILVPYGTGAVAVTAENCLLGVDAECDIADKVSGGSCYVISGGSRDEDGDGNPDIVGVGFYLYEAPNRLKAHKAYTVIPHGSSPAPRYMPFIFNTTEGIEDVQPSAVGSQKRIENGQLIIEKNGIRYNAEGQIIR